MSMLLTKKEEFGGWAWWWWSGGLGTGDRANTLGIQGCCGAAGPANGAVTSWRVTRPTFIRAEAPTLGTLLDLALCTSSIGCSSVSFITKGRAGEGREGSSMAEGSWRVILPQYRGHSTATWGDLGSRKAWMLRAHKHTSSSDTGHKKHDHPLSTKPSFYGVKRILSNSVRSTLCPQTSPSCCTSSLITLHHTHHSHPRQNTGHGPSIYPREAETLIQKDIPMLTAALFTTLVYLHNGILFSH